MFSTCCHRYIFFCSHFDVSVRTSNRCYTQNSLGFDVLIFSYKFRSPKIQVIVEIRVNCIFSVLHRLLLFDIKMTLLNTWKLQFSHSKPVFCRWSIHNMLLFGSLPWVLQKYTPRCRYVFFRFTPKQYDVRPFAYTWFHCFAIQMWIFQDIKSNLEVNFSIHSPNCLIISTRLLFDTISQAKMN